MKLGFKHLASGLLALVTTVSLAGCAGMDAEFSAQKAEADFAIAELQKEKLVGYQMSGFQAGTYGLDYQNPNSHFALTKTSISSSADECKAFISFAGKLRASAYTVDISQPWVSIKKNEPQEQIACVSALSLDPSPGIDQVGSTQFRVAGVMSHNSTQIPFVLSFNRSISKSNLKAHFDLNGPATYVAEVSTMVGETQPESTETWIDARAQLDRQYRAYVSALDLIGDSRYQHPAASPYSRASLDVALKDWAKTFTHTKIEYLKSTDGQIKRLRISPKGSSSTLPICVSIVKFDEKFYGVPDPHSGYSIGYIKEIDDSSAFGQATTNKCESP